MKNVSFQTKKWLITSLFMLCFVVGFCQQNTSVIQVRRIITPFGYKNCKNEISLKNQRDCENKPLTCVAKEDAFIQKSDVAVNTFTIIPRENKLTIKVLNEKEDSVGMIEMKVIEPPFPTILVDFEETAHDRDESGKGDLFSQVKIRLEPNAQFLKDHPTEARYEFSNLEVCWRACFSCLTFQKVDLSKFKAEEEIVLQLNNKDFPPRGGRLGLYFTFDKIYRINSLGEKIEIPFTNMQLFKHFP